jgi:hypothetical protein
VSHVIALHRTERAGRTGGTIAFEVMVGPNAAVAQVNAPGGRSAIGDSKRANGEPFDREVAIDLAVGRALMALGASLVEGARS